jgi:hypothetical protein
MNPKSLYLVTLAVLLVSACGGQPPATSTASPTRVELVPSQPPVTVIPTSVPNPLVLTPTDEPEADVVDGSFTDPFRYCAAVGTIDTPDARYVGPALPEEIVFGLREVLQIAPSSVPATFAALTSWRCRQGRVVACNRGIDNSCHVKADTQRTPSPAIEQFCQGAPNSDFVPPAVTRASIYTWRCRQSQAEIIQERAPLDVRGFPSDSWHEIILP